MSDVTERHYATFPRRFRAAVVDATLIAIVTVAGVILVDAAVPATIGRAGFILAIVTVILYEPVLVSVRGQTVGHALLHVRVVDDEHDTTVGFVRAAIRALLKAVFGILSFFLMAFTRQHQAIHDRVTRSVVVVDHDSAPGPIEYSEARRDVNVSVVRRMMMMLVYYGATYLIVNIALLMLLRQDCILLDQCTPVEDDIYAASTAMLLIALIFVVIQGWRGRLPGARARRVDPDEAVSETGSDPESTLEPEHDGR